MLDQLESLNQMQYDKMGDPEIVTKIQQYEMAYRMQTSVPEVTDLSHEPDHIIKLYGPDCLVAGTYVANCLLARKLAENGVRFIQLYHQGWDQHGNLPNEMAGQAQDVDQASAALVQDLKQRGLLEDTLVIWGENSDGPIIVRANWNSINMVAIITRGHSVHGLRVGVSRRESYTAKRMNSGIISLRTLFTFMISMLHYFI